MLVSFVVAVEYEIHNGWPLGEWNMPLHIGNRRRHGIDAMVIRQHGVRGAVGQLKLDRSCVNLNTTTAKYCGWNGCRVKILHSSIQHVNVF